VVKFVSKNRSEPAAGVDLIGKGDCGGQSVYNRVDERRPNMKIRNPSACGSVPTLSQQRVQVPRSYNNFNQHSFGKEGGFMNVQTHAKLRVTDNSNPLLVHQERERRIINNRDPKRRRFL